MGFVEVLKKRAKENIKTIVLPETEDMRTLEATDKILKEGVAKIVLIGNEETIKAKAAEGGFDISGATIVDPETSDRTQAYIDKFVELRAKKGMTPEKAKEILHTQYPYYGVMMVKMGEMCIRDRPMLPGRKQRQSLRKQECGRFIRTLNFLLYLLWIPWKNAESA